MGFKNGFKPSNSAGTEKRATRDYCAKGSCRYKGMEKGNCFGICRRSIWQLNPARSEKMTTRIYYRVSTDKQDFEMQRHAVLRLLASKGIEQEECVIYQDFGLSGTTSQRPDYQKLLTEVLEGDLIVVYEFSRLWRDMEEQSRATKMLLALGVQISSVADGDLRTFNDSLSIGIKGVINQYEAQRFKERSMAGIKAKKALVAQGLDVWNPRGPDKKKRSSEGYKKEQERRRVLKVGASQ